MNIYIYISPVEFRSRFDWINGGRVYLDIKQHAQAERDREYTRSSNFDCFGLALMKSLRNGWQVNMRNKPNVT